MIRCFEERELREVDQAKLRGLLESAFGRMLAPWYFAEKRITRLYLAGEYRGVAILTSEGGEAPYLDKLAVAPGHQGNSVANELWKRLRSEHPALYWRARPDSPRSLLDWYQKRATSWRAARGWVVYWYGLGPGAERAAVRRASRIPASFPPLRS